jgi:PAS domain S-box-containing protein
MQKLMNKFSDKPFLLVKEGVVIQTGEQFTLLTGFCSEEITGYSIDYIEEKLRSSFQLEHEIVNDNKSLFIFGKSLEPIEVAIKYVDLEEGESLIIFEAEKGYNYNKSFNVIEKLNTDKTTGFIVMSCPDLTVLKVNQEFIKTLDEPYNNIETSLGKKISEIVPDFEKSKMHDLFNQVIVTGMPYFEEEHEVYNLKRGTTFWNISLVTILDENEKKYMLMSILEVTKRVVQRKEIEQKNKQLEAIFENMSDGLFIVDNEGNYIKMNKKAKEITYKADSMKKVGDTLAYTKYFDLEGKEMKLDKLPLPRIQKGETVKNFIFSSKGPYGEHHFSANGSPIYDEYGNVDKSIVLLSDVTERIKYEEHLYFQTQYDTLNSIINSMNMGFLRVSYPKLNVVGINKMFYEILKDVIPELPYIDEIVGSSIYECFDEKFIKIDRIIEMLNDESRLSNKMFNYSRAIQVSISGEEKHYRVIFQPVFRLNNEVAELAVLCIDVTNEVIEKNLAKESLKMEEEFFINITHELKTPLNVIYSANQLMSMQMSEGLNNTNKDSFERNMKIIKQNCYRLTKLVNNIVDLSKIESGHLDLNLQNVNIVELVEDIVQSIYHYIEGNGLNVIFDTDTEEKIMAVDSYKIERIILNLMSNAIKFSDKGNEITVTVQDKGNYVEIDVKDNGVGMEKEYLDAIFERFHQIDKTLSRNAEGSGIGLALVKSLVEMHGGEIKVESKLGEGSTFKVILPARLIDETDNNNFIKFMDNKSEKINIEFSDIYSI